MNVRIEKLQSKVLVGKSLQMSFADNKTAALWGSFMPEMKMMLSGITTNLYSLQIYPPGFFNQFNPRNSFEKWAAVEVGDNWTIPDGWNELHLPGGLYAVFIYRGRSTEGAAAFRYIMEEWLPQSSYQLDDRPHFELLGAKYKNDDPESEEEIWIPVKLK